MEGRRQCERTCVYTRIGTCWGTGTNVTAAEFIRDELREFCDLQCATSSLQLFIIDTGQAKRRAHFYLRSQTTGKLIRNTKIAAT